jgi:hypothetical protein
MAYEWRDATMADNASSDDATGGLIQGGGLRLEGPVIDVVVWRADDHATWL